MTEATGESKPSDVRGLPILEELARGDHVELAERMLATIRAEGPVPIFDEGSLHTYDAGRGLWRVVGPAEQSRILQSFAGIWTQEKRPRQLKLRAPDVTGSIKLAGHRVARSGFFSEAPRGLVFANGFVRVDGKRIELTPPDPENRARLGYAFPYVGNVAALAWLTFLHALFRDDDDREEKILFVQEFFGASLLGVAPTYQRCLVAAGGGENGKSKLGDIVCAAMPEGSTCAIAPQVFASEYRRALLVGKRLNVVNELPEADMLASEQFKAIVAGDAIDARHIREAPFTFRPQAGHYFAANRLPGTSDQTFAYWRRFVVVRFGRSFKNDPARDPNIAEKIIAAELPAIVAWLLEGAVRVMRQGGYTIPSSHEAELATWRRGADQVALFAAERTVPSKDERPLSGRSHDWCPAADLYDAYHGWAERNGHRPPLASNKFGMRMAELGKASKHTERGNFYPVRLRRGDEPLNDTSPGPSVGIDRGYE